MAGRGVLYDSAASDPLHLEVARITSELNSTSGQAVYIDQGSEGLYLECPMSFRERIAGAMESAKSFLAEADV